MFPLSIIRTFADWVMWFYHDKAIQDPLRPRWHYSAPSHWLNDPNGVIWHDGKYEMFYQLKPYHEQDKHLHWGHADSDDLTHWRHQPIALYPNKYYDEQHCFSGCCVISPTNGLPYFFYTSVLSEGCGGMPPQRRAVGSPNFQSWIQEYEPFLEGSVHSPLDLNDWRDPFYFNHNGHHYMVLGGGIKGDDPRPCVFLYEAKDKIEGKWDYVGILYERPKHEYYLNTIECPNFIRFGDKYVLLTSIEFPENRVECNIGIFNEETHKFEVESTQWIDFGNLYASNIIINGEGQVILMGWAQWFPTREYWSGCMVYPRILTLDENNIIHQVPYPKVDTLHTEAIKLATDGSELKSIIGREFDIKFDVKSMNNLEIEIVGLCKAIVDNGKVTISDRSGDIEKKDSYQFRLFVDNGLVELFIDDRWALTKVHDACPDGDYEIIIKTDGKISKVEAYKMQNQGVITP